MVKQNASTMSFAFWWIVKTQTEWVPEDEMITHDFGRSEQNFDSPLLCWGCFSLNAVYNSFKLHRKRRFCLWIFLPMLTKSFFPDINLENLSSLKNNGTFLMITSSRLFPFFGGGIASIPFSLYSFWASLTFYSLTWKNWAILAREQLSGAVVSTWIFSLVFKFVSASFSFMRLWGQSNSFTFWSVSLSWESTSLWML